MYYINKCSCIVIESSFDPGERLQASLFMQYIDTKPFIYTLNGIYVNN
jgi:hypothetical protein